MNQPLEPFASVPIQYFRIAVTDNAAFEAICQRANALYLEMLEDLQKARLKQTSSRFNPRTALVWFRQTHPELMGKLERVYSTQGEIDGVAFMRAKWEQAHPQRPVGRPEGGVTREKLKAVANWRAIAEYTHSPSKTNGKTKPTIRKVSRSVHNGATP